MKNINFNLVTKEVLTSCLLFAFTTISAQPELIKLDRLFGIGNSNELIVLSDSDVPIKEGTCKKLRSVLTKGSKGLWSRYYFEDVPKEGQWYKDFVFFKVTQPAYFFSNDRKALYDVVNKHFVTYSDIVESIQYMYLRKEYKQDAKPEDYFTFTINGEDIQLETFNTRLKTTEVCSTKQYDDGKTYLDFKPKGEEKKTPISIYRFTNVDFINDELPDYNVNTDANYLMLQRDYKLGQTYNTVIFPVDVPVYDYHHVYNNGKNRMIVYKLASIDDNTLNFIRDVSGVLKANTPYIIKSEANDNSSTNESISEYYLSETPVDHFDINCVKEVMNANDVRIFAQYQKQVIQNKDNINKDEDIYVVSGNKLVSCRNIENTTVNRFRWYIKRPRSNSAKPMTMTFDGVTDINTVEFDKTINSDIYTLSGIKIGKQANIKNLPRGCYIINGKVVKI